MFVKQITQEEALKLAADGKEVMVMIPDSEREAVWGDMTPDTMQNLLSGLMFSGGSQRLKILSLRTRRKSAPPPTSQQSLLEVLQELPLVPTNQPPTVWVPVKRGKRE